MQTRYEPTTANIKRCMERPGTYHFRVISELELPLLRSRIAVQAEKHRHYTSSTYDPNKQLLQVRVRERT